MKFIRDILIRSVFVYAALFIGQLVKYPFIHDIDPSLIDLIISGLLGLYLAEKLIKKIDN